MRLVLCGVRGSTPTPGPDFVRYGGHTSCVAITDDGEPPRLVLDAGTGITRLTQRMDDAAFRGTVLLGHLHWDHTHGIPFFRAGDLPESEVRLLMPAQGDPHEVLGRAISPPHFPITVDQLRGRWTVENVDVGDWEAEGYAVLAREIPHKGGRAFGYRISDGSRTITYMSDHCPISLGEGEDGVGEYHPAAIELCRGSDLVIHDAQYTTPELMERPHFGHSAVEYAIRLAERSGARRVMLFHHDPSRTDEQLDEIVAGIGSRDVEVIAAVEGSEIDV